MAKRLTKDDFLYRFENVHGNKYDYSLMEYTNRDIKIKIICPKHGIFEQTPHNHENGQGCPKCGRDIVKKNINREVHYGHFYRCWCSNRHSDVSGW